jgi:peptidyl-prolyl cis-trans isomerase SurA
MKTAAIKLVFVFIILSFFIASAHAQLEEGQTIDKIVAVVGNEIITQSDVEGSMAVLAQQDPSLNINDPDVQSQIIDALINDKLIVMKAKEDSIVVSDEEIEQRMEFELSKLVQYYGSKSRLENVYGMSMDQLKAEIRDQIENKLLAERVSQQKFMDIKVTPREVEEFYNENIDSIPQLPDQVLIYHIVKNVEADIGAKEDIYELARSIRDSILQGGDFADFAARYSDDPQTAKSGGDLPWFAKGNLYREFEDAAFALDDNEISIPVETPFGFHLIQTLDKNKDSVRTRHILFKVGGTTDDDERAKQFLLDLKKRAEAGEDFEELAKAYSDEAETKGFGGKLGRFMVSQIPQNLKDVVNKLPVKGISDPILYRTTPKKSFHIIYKKAYIESHKPDLEKDYEDLEIMAINYKQRTLYNDWIQQLRKEMYWEIKK